MIPERQVFCKICGSSKMIDIDQWRAAIGRFVTIHRAKQKKTVITDKIAGVSVHSLMTTLLFVASVLTLLRSGDVELNPGPGPNTRHNKATTPVTQKQLTLSSSLSTSRLPPMSEQT